MVDHRGDPDSSGWRVLLIGGSSGTGKTVLAHQLARQFGIGLTQIDDLRLALQRVTTPDSFPELHYFLSPQGVWQQSPAALRDGLIGVGRVISQALEPIISHHLDTPYPLILEGDGILPELVEALARAGLDTMKVRSLFLYEPDEAGLMANMTERGRGFDHQAESEQQAQVQMNWLYGQWLKAEAERHGLPLVSTRPRDTLLAQATRVIAGAAPRTSPPET